ncbi:MAG: hypothetical protein HFE28_00730 [Clostridia bacterium]|jgi:hypothetical protein|nr:hypothetical protein [Clostridia bacterium]
MSKKSELKRAIADTEKEIEALEKKRARSQSVLLSAVVTKSEPNPTDVEYFRVFTALIDERRQTLRQLMDELENLKK